MISLDFSETNLMAEFRKFRLMQDLPVRTEMDRVEQADAVIVTI